MFQEQSRIEQSTQKLDEQNTVKEVFIDILKEYEFRSMLWDKYELSLPMDKEALVDTNFLKHLPPKIAHDLYQKAEKHSYQLELKKDAEQMQEQIIYVSSDGKLDFSINGNLKTISLLSLGYKETIPQDLKYKDLANIKTFFHAAENRKLLKEKLFDPKKVNVYEILSTIDKLEDEI